LDHPWFAVSDADGKFAIEGVPAGNYEFVLWHERAGYLERRVPVTIVAGKIAELERVYDAKLFEPVEAQQAPPAALIEIARPLAARNVRQALTELLEDVLQKKLNLIDRACTLKDDQKKKLWLAGQGDIHRALERVEDLIREQESRRGNAEAG